MKKCSVCAHTDCLKMEQVAMQNPMSYSSVAKEYGVSIDDLKLHMILHTGEEMPSLVRDLKLKEADILHAVANDYLVTINHVGSRIVQYLDDPDYGPRLITRPLVELYLGAGTEIRQIVRTLADLKAQIDGDLGGPRSGLAALSEAIQASIR